jgi:hypothetical protein
MKKRLINDIVVSLLLCLILIPVSAGAFDVSGLQPISPYGIFSTFSAESIPAKKIGIGIKFEKSFDPDYYRSLASFAYGIKDNLEISATFPYVGEWNNSVSGFEDISIGVKHRLFDETRYSPAAAYLLTVSLPAGRDVFSTDGSYGAGVLFTKKVGPFKGHLNFLYSHPNKEGLKDEYKLNAGVDLAVTHDSKILAEISGKKNYFKKRIDFLEWKVGYRIAASDNIYTSIGFGFDIKKRSPDYRFIFSFSFILPAEKEKIQKIYE